MAIPGRCVRVSTHNGRYWTTTTQFNALGGAAFDLLHLNGRDPTGQSLIDRKAALGRMLDKADGTIRYSPHIDGNGAAA